MITKLLAQGCIIIEQHNRFRRNSIFSEVYYNMLFIKKYNKIDKLVEKIHPIFRFDTQYNIGDIDAK